MLTHEFQKRVRYNETDQMGYLYHAHYITYYEIGRVEMLRSLGLSYQEMEEKHRVMMPVMSVQTRYVRPARYDELLTIRTTLRHIPTQYITFHMEILNEQGKLVNGGSVKLCFVDMETNKTVAPPDFLLEAVKAASKS